MKKVILILISSIILSGCYQSQINRPENQYAQNERILIPPKVEKIWFEESMSPEGIITPAHWKYVIIEQARWDGPVKRKGISQSLPKLVEEPFTNEETILKQEDQQMKELKSLESQLDSIDAELNLLVE